MKYKKNTNLCITLCSMDQIIDYMATGVVYKIKNILNTKIVILQRKFKPNFPVAGRTIRFLLRGSRTDSDE